MGSNSLNTPVNAFDANLAKAEGFRPGRIGFVYGAAKIAR
jgi:hypothetical protein